MTNEEELAEARIVADQEQQKLRALTPRTPEWKKQFARWYDACQWVRELNSVLTVERRLR